MTRDDHKLFEACWSTASQAGLPVDETIALARQLYDLVEPKQRQAYEEWSARINARARAAQTARSRPIEPAEARPEDAAAIGFGERDGGARQATAEVAITCGGISQLNEASAP